MIRNFFSNKKNIISTILILITLYVCVFTNFHYTDGYKETTYYVNTDDLSAKLSTGDIIEQEFILGEGDQGVSILLGTYVTHLERGTIVAEIYDENDNKISEQRLDARTIEDNVEFEIYFGDLPESLYNTKCTLKLTFLDIDGQMLAIYASKEDKRDLTYTFNGVPQPDDIVMKGLQRCKVIIYDDIRLVYVLVIALVAIYYGFYKIRWNEINLKECVKTSIAWVKDNRKTILIGLLLFIASIVLAKVIEHFAAQEKGYTNPAREYLVFVTAIIASFTVLCKKYIWKYAHIYFFIVSMLVGTVNIIALPPVAAGWDETVHYSKVAVLSKGGKEHLTIADEVIVRLDGNFKYDNIFVKADRDNWEAYLNMVGTEATVRREVTLNSRSIAYVPGSIALYLGRELGFNAVSCYMLGKGANLLMYSLFLALAIKCLNNRGKILVSVLGLIPTSMYMATTYSYDQWVYALVILGLAMLIGELQTKGTISVSNTIKSTLVLIIGLLPKATYFPLMFPMMLLKKDKYEDSKKSRIIIFLGMVIMLSTFILPLFFTGGGDADTRGGSGLNPGAQIMFILTNPIAFAGILIEFLWNYMSPDAASGYTTMLAYQGIGKYFTVCLLLMCVAAIIDNSEKTIFKGKEKLCLAGNWLGILGSLAFAAASLYVSFTPVQATTINGMQPRYILPILFSILYFAGEYKIEVSKEIKGKVFIWTTLTMAAIFLLGVYELIIVRY